MTRPAKPAPIRPAGSSVKPCRAWALVTPRGSICYMVHATRKALLSELVNEHGWTADKLHRDGYRIVKVTITPGWKGGK